MPTLQAVPRIFTDAELDALRSEGKVLPPNWRARLVGKARQGSGSVGGSFELRGEQENVFRLYARRNIENLFDFSVGLAFIAPDGTSYMLARYNGSSHAHTNVLEQQFFEDRFHIHRGTERYLQKFGVDGMDRFAEPTERFYSYDSAMDLAIADLGFASTDNDDIPNLFGEE